MDGLKSTFSPVANVFTMKALGERGRREEKMLALGEEVAGAVCEEWMQPGVKNKQ